MVYYINFDGIFCSVFDSQVYMPVKMLKERDINISLINFDRDRWKNKEVFDKKYGDIKTALDNKVYLTNKIRKGNYFEPLLLNLYLKKIETIVTKGKEEEPVLLHCRGYFASYLALKLKGKLTKYNIKVIIDLRGKEDDEYTDIYGTRNIIYRRFLPIVLNKIGKIEEYIIKNADYIFCVTNTFKEYVVERYKISEDMIKVIPTCINYKDFKYSEGSRMEIRNKLKIADKFIVIYSGAGQSWQQPEVLIDTFIRIKKVMPSAFFLILTKDKEVFSRYADLNKLPNEDFVITNCSYNEVYKYLSAADLGLLIRKNDGVNMVASPTKFAEYMSCHVPIILSRGIGDLDKFVQQYNIGIYYEEINTLGEKILNVNRCVNDFEDIVLTYYDWNTKVNEIIDIYNSLI